MENNVLAYNRALAQGDLVDASAIGRDVGFEWPVALAKAVHTAVVRQSGGNVEDGLWDLLFAARIQLQEFARNHASAAELDIRGVVGIRRGQGALVHAHLVVGEDEETKQPCIVLTKPAFLEKTSEPTEP